MAGIFFSRVFSRCKKGCSSSFSAQYRYANSSRAKAPGSSQRKIHTSTKRNNRASQLLINRTNLLQAKFSQLAQANVASGSLLDSIKANGIRTVSTSVTEGTSQESSEVSTMESCREASDNTSDSLTDSAFIPDSTAIDIDMSSPFDTAQDIIASGMGEVPLSSLGLGGYTPVGLIQNLLDFVHLQVGLPWWAAIVAGTVAFRAFVFPIMVKGQVNSQRLTAIKPELERLQEKLREVSNLQNPNARVQTSMELQQLFQKHDCHPAKALISPLVQLPLFVSFFLALRQMSYLPVDAMKTGGLLWFPDLTAADPFFVLPVVCAATMLLTIETGAEAGMANPQMKMMKNVFRGMCFVMIPLTYNFPTGIFLYWMTSNSLSLLQVSVMKLPAVKKYFGIPDSIIQPVDPNVKTGSFVENLRAGYKSAQEVAMVKHTERMKEKQYKSSLNDAYNETFEYNPRLKENEKLFEEAKNKQQK